MEKLELGESKLFPGKKHENMLLEMCGELIGDCYANGDETIGFFEAEFKAKRIPWLEVCMVHIPNAMGTPNNGAREISIRLTCHIHKFFHHPKHPVDYLYGEYISNKAWRKS